MATAFISFSHAKSCVPSNPAAALNEGADAGLDDSAAAALAVDDEGASVEAAAGVGEGGGAGPAVPGVRASS